MGRDANRSRAIEAYLRAYFTEVTVEKEHIMKVLHTNEIHHCDLCSGIAHYDSAIHNKGLAWHYLCEICMSSEGEITEAIRIIHTCDCKYCEAFLTWEERQSVLPF